MAKGMKLLDWIAVSLLIVGGINWGLVGLLNFNVVTKLLGFSALLVDAVYILVGAAAVYSIYVFVKK